MPTRLDDNLVADSLGALTDWSGDGKHIQRTVSVAGAAQEQLLGEVAATADAMDHHPEVERHTDAVTFVLWTHSEGGVTELDIAFASRIDDLVLQMSGDDGTTVVAGAPTAAGSGDGSVGTGRRQGGAQRSDTDVVAEDSRSGQVPGGNADIDNLEPLVGVPSAAGGTVQPGLATPDTAPDEPEPGVASQGTAPGPNDDRPA